MATKKQKQELIDTLKFTPVKARIYIQGYGGECYIGRVTREEYEAYKRGRVDLDQYANDWSMEEEGCWGDIPEKLRIFPPGSPYDCDNLCHASGATMDDSSCIVIEDEHGNTLWESTLDIASLTDKGVSVGAGGDVWESADEPDGTIVFWGGQGEKGVFFDGEFTLKAPFDPNKLHISYSEADGWQLSSGVEYDDEDIEGYDGYSTTGKWSEYKFHIIGDEEVYEGVERDPEEDSDEDDTEEQDAVIPDFHCTKCAWQGLVDQLHYPDEDADGVCPECFGVVTTDFDGWDAEAELAKIDVPVMEGEEMWASEAIDQSMYSPWHSGDLEPLRRGFYDVEYASGSWPFSIDDRIKWTGKKWKHNRPGDNTIVRWRGLAEPAK